MDTLEVTGVTGGYGKVPIVQDVSIHARQGQVVSIIGPNGAGKSTFLKVIAGVLSATSGSVKVNGSEIINLPANKVARLG
ncbi:MAG TPA: ATP-binding cassette domain-containing protein, partial [Ktedonobacterales bacterium]|nr:ATP-binding cassette domain-containing protein [Ktedonobacterales bacterium]